MQAYRTISEKGTAAYEIQKSKFYLLQKRSHVLSTRYLWKRRFQRFTKTNCKEKTKAVI